MRGNQKYKALEIGTPFKSPKRLKYINNTWMPREDSNLDKRSQSPVSYR